MKPDKKHTKQMIKTTALVLAAAIMMSIAVTACSDKRENPETPENPTTGATDITAAPTDENDAASTTEAPWCHSEIITGTEPDNIEIITPTSILEAQSQEESSKGTKTHNVQDDDNAQNRVQNDHHHVEKSDHHDHNQSWPHRMST
ncbi:MAG: hypothetical protein ACOYH4_05330 [Saccharofermentanales bacterium]|jgi:hypothetical protein